MWTWKEAIEKHGKRWKVKESDMEAKSSFQNASEVGAVLLKISNSGETIGYDLLGWRGRQLGDCIS